jgi:hypothetical protein
VFLSKAPEHNAAFIQNDAVIENSQTLCKTAQATNEKTAEY